MANIKNFMTNATKYLTREVVLGLFTLIFFVLLFSLTNFKSASGIMLFLREVSFLLIASIAMTMIILTGNIDISAGTMMGLCGYMAAYVAKMGYPIYVFVLVAVATGVFFASINGILVTVFKVPSIVATLAMVNVHLGFFILLPHGGWVENMKPNFTFLGNAELFNCIPIIFLISISIFIFFLWFMKYNRFSKRLYAIGGNANGAILAGVNNSKTVFQVFLWEGVLIGIAAILFYTPKTIVQANSTFGMEMLFITAVVVGGTNIMGGRGKLLGTGIGVVLVALINRAMIFFGFQDYYSYTVQGVIIIIAVLFTVTDFKELKYSFRRLFYRHKEV